MSAGDRCLPWVRLVGAVWLGFMLVAVGSSAWIGRLFVRMQQEEFSPEYGLSPEMMDTLRALSLAGWVDAGVFIFSGWCTALVLLVLGWRSPGLRLPAGLAGLGFMGSTTASLAVVAQHFEAEPDLSDPLTLWFRIGAIACVVAWGAVTVLVHLVTRDRAHRGPALAAVGVAAVWAGVHVWGAFVIAGAPAPSWWSERVFFVTTANWISLLGWLGLGLGLWLAGSPAKDDDTKPFDAATVAGLRLAQIVLWWRVGLATCAVLAVIAGMMKMRSAGADSVSWLLKAAPWLGYAEIALGLVMLMGLACVVLQRRSSLAATLAALGAVLLLATTMLSFGENLLLHQIVHDMSARTDGLRGSSLRDHAEITMALEPTARGLGMAGMVSTIAGLIVLARRSGLASQLRAWRFLGLGMVFTLSWLYGREALAELGTGLLLLTPLVLAAAIWMVLDLSTFMGEVADGLDERREP